MTQYNPPCLPWEFYGWAGAACSYVPESAYRLWDSEEVKNFKRTTESRYHTLDAIKCGMYRWQGWERLTWQWPAHLREDVRR